VHQQKIFVVSVLSNSP